MPEKIIVSKCDKKDNKNKGFALVYVIVMVLIMFLLAYTFINVMRQESASSFAHLESSVAHFIAETGVEHALYILRTHRTTDVIPTLNVASPLDINKSFGQLKNFEMDIPFDAPDDVWSNDLYVSDINQKIKEQIPEGKINSIKLKFDVQKNFNDDNLVYGLMTITCQGEYRGTKRSATAQRLIEVYRDLSIMYDHSFVANNPSEEMIPARRVSDSLMSKLTLNSPFIPQYLIVNNGCKWNSEEPTKSIIFGRNLKVCLNEMKGTGLLELATIVGPLLQWASIKSFMENVNNVPMILKLHSPSVDSKLDKESPIAKYLPRDGSSLNLKDILNLEAILGQNQVLCEYDTSTGPLAGLLEAWKSIASSPGGTRGNIDLTGHFPALTLSEKIGEGFQSAIHWALPKFFDAPKKTLHNEIVGVKRLYGYFDTSKGADETGLLAGIGNFFKKVGQSLGFGQWVSKMKVVDTEAYDFEATLAIDASKYPAKLPHLYDIDVYKRIALRHNIILDKAETISPGKTKRPHYYDDSVNKVFFEERKFTGGSFPLIGEVKVKNFKSVVWRPFWGWATKADDCPPQSWYKFSFTKNIFEAARQLSEYAIPVDGVYYVDGDVLIEGYYKGNGVIVATGNIIIGGTIQRHKDDEVGDPGCEKNPEFLSGPYNRLQLIALGTKDSPNYPGITGKIIFAPHAYDPAYFGNGWVQSIFSKNPQFRVDAYLYGVNGMMMDLESRDSGAFKLFSGSDDTFTTINGNFACEKLDWQEKDNCYPDKIMINKFQKWVDIVDDAKKEKYCTINYGNQSDGFIQQRELK